MKGGLTLMNRGLGAWWGIGLCRLALRGWRLDSWRSEPTKEVAKLDPADVIEGEAVALNKIGRTKGGKRKTVTGSRLVADVVESLKASGPGYNARVEQALRAAGFGAAKGAVAKEAAKRAPPAKRRA